MNWLQSSGVVHRTRQGPRSIVVQRHQLPHFTDAEWGALQQRTNPARGLPFYDLRHAWASWHVQSGTSLQELMELGGWKSYEMVLRYAHLAPEKLNSVARRIERQPSPDILVRRENVARTATFSLPSVH